MTQTHPAWRSLQMFQSARTLTVVTLLALPLSAQAFGLRSSRTVCCYPAMPVIVAQPLYICVTAPLYAQPVAPPRPLAQPVPAPPSRNPLTPPRTQEPPLGVPSTPNVRESRRTPNVADSQPYYNAYPLAPGNDSPPAAGLCRVSVWNLTSQPVTLKVGDRQQV